VRAEEALDHFLRDSSGGGEQRSAPKVLDVLKKLGNEVGGTSEVDLGSRDLAWGKIARPPVRFFTSRLYVFKLHDVETS